MRSAGNCCIGSTSLTERPLVALSFVWIVLLILDFTRGLSDLLQMLSYAIWALFGLDFIIEIIIAPDKRTYLRRNWLTAVSLLLPALRVLRIFRALRLLRAARATRSISMVRLVTSLNRGMRAIGTLLERRGVGYVIMLTIIMTFAGAAGMAYFESPAALLEAGYAEAVQEGAGFQSYGEAVWWTAMIMTTMGSEEWPKTAEGRLLTWLLSLYAFAIFGYITATIASFFIAQERAAGQQASAASSAALAPELHAELAALRQQLTSLRQQIESQQPQPAPDHSIQQASRGRDEER